MSEVYTHGHHDSVLRSHRNRTVENSAHYVEGRLAPGLEVLDMGCGPGSITVDLAQRVAPGKVTGIDAEGDVLEEARALQRDCGLTNVTFEEGDVYGLPFADGSFDLVHAHQLLQHLQEPVRALRELWRVLKPGGTLAVRDSDYGAFVWAPSDPILDRWLELYHQVTARNGAEADAGRHLLAWVHRAGFDDVDMTSSTWTYADSTSRAWWGGLWADRVRLSAFARQSISYGLATEDELEAISHAWRRWAASPDATFIVVHGEVLATRSP